MPNPAPRKLNPLVLVGLPTLQTAPLSWQWSDAFYSLQMPLGCGQSRLRVENKAVDVARNEIVQTALNINADYVFFVSDDVILPPSAFMQLWCHNWMMTTGVYWTKNHPVLPYLWMEGMKGPFVEWKVGETFPVDMAGIDCLLVHTDVFRAIEPPWFSLDWKFQEHDRPNPNITEDFYFFAKAKQAGFSLMCDTNVQCGHQDRSNGIVWGLTDDMPFMRERYVPMENEIFVADIGCGNSTPWFGDKVKLMRYDGDPNVRPDVVCDLMKIPEPPDYFDIVHSRHALEHFAPMDTVKAVKEWIRILKPGGQLQIKVPSLTHAARQIVRAADDPDFVSDEYPLLQLYGAQTGADDSEVHRNAFTKNALQSVLEVAGLDNVVVEETEEGQNLFGTGIKAANKQFVMMKEWPLTVSSSSSSSSLANEGIINNTAGADDDAK